MNSETAIPFCVCGLCEPMQIAKMFGAHFKVQSSLGDVSDVVLADNRQAVRRVSFSLRKIDRINKSMRRGRSPGHDGISIECFLHAGAHLLRIQKIIYNLCNSQCYFPDSPMKTNMSIVKNKTEDASDKSNYRPISLATVAAKVLDGLLGDVLSRYIKTQRAQFGFKPNVSTKSAIMCFKHTVYYYTKAKAGLCLFFGFIDGFR